MLCVRYCRDYKDKAAFCGRQRPVGAFYRTVGEAVVDATTRVLHGSGRGQADMVDAVRPVSLMLGVHHSGSV